MYKKVLALSALLISSCSTDNQYKGTMHHSDFELSDSAVKIQIKSGNKTISGSGTWIDEQHILTASHLWLEASKDYSLSIITRHGSIPATVINIDDPENRDLALLKVEQNNIVKAPPNWKLPVCDNVLAPGESVWVLSGMYNTLSNTYASPDSTYYYKSIVGSDGLTGFFQNGVSGSAVLNQSKSCLYGVVSQQDIKKINVYQLYITRITTNEIIRGFIDP
ncbi:serine protease [Enterobacter hormaechei]|uniref:S1 family peptidase n=1 Tax=Enterobacter hormaechei TaxID=158836 RepID=UPI002FF11FD6